MKKVVCLWSGGLDSSYLIEYLVRQNCEVIPVYVEYPHHSLNAELRVIEKLYLEYFLEVWEKHVHAPILVPLNTSSFLKVALTDKTVRASKSTDWNFKETKFNEYVPSRNIMFLSIASSVALVNDCTTLAIASHKEELFPFPDSSRTFLDAFEQALNVGTNKHNWRILTPFIEEGWYKWDVLKHAINDGFPVEHTISCYTPIDGKPCKTCRACNDRMTAFEKISEMPP
jgi:7-cyano-7-deazaguanine synthase